MEVLKLIILFLTFWEFSSGYKTYYMEQNQEVHHSSSDNRFQIYCYIGKPKYIIHIWQTVLLEIKIRNNKYVVYEGPTPNDVSKEYFDERSIWSINFFSQKRQKRFKLDPFNTSCIGINSDEDYNVHLLVVRIDYWKVLFLSLGIFLFVSAKKLSRNIIFYYLCGISFGVAASFLILIYFISKLFPRKPVMYGVAICGWTVGVYLIQLLWENIRLILSTYQNYVVGYIFITGVISFLVCYRFGPVTNRRTHNLIQWSLQISSLILIFFSSQFPEAAMGQIVLLVLGYNLFSTFLYKSQKYWKRHFPPKIKLLTNDEYYRQGARETTKALANLKKFCNSPECKQWSTMLKLRDANRFASFMEGASHLSDEEILEYETSLTQTEVTDDEYTEEDD